MSINRKNPKADLRENYRIFFEIGLIIVLAIFIIAMKVEFRSAQNELDFSQEQEIIQIKDVKRTVQEEQPPAPLPPPNIIVVPDHKMLSDNLTFPDFDEWNRKELIPPKTIKTGSDERERIFDVVENMPVLKNKKEFYNDVRYPRECKLANIEGTVYIRFVVTKTGAIENAKVLKGIGGGCDEYALNYVIKYADFSIGRQRGNPVSVKFTIPITFNLQ